MPRDDALLQAVLDTPEDDTPRLVYADWLEERGDAARAEFIRVQVALARLGEDDPQREALEQRERALRSAHEAGWLGPLPAMVSEARFGRGFVERVTLGVRQFLTHAASLFERVPLREVKLLRLAQARDGAAEVAKCPCLARLRGLDLGRSSAGDLNVATLLASGHLANLTNLRLYGSQAGEETLRRLRAPALARLEALDLGNNFLRPRIALLTGGAVPFRLKSLDLSDNDLDREAAAGLAGWSGLEGLRELDLANNRLRVTGAQHLAASALLAGLRRLGLRNCAIGVTGMRALAASAHLAGLGTLEVSGNGIGRKGLRAVLESPYLTGLTALHLGGNQIGDEGVAMLARWPFLARQRALHLSDNGITDRGLALLAESPAVANVRELNLSANGFGDAGLRAVAQSPHLRELRVLRLVGNYQVTDAGTRALLDSPHLARLRYLKVYDVPLSQECLRALAERFELQSGASEVGPL